VPRLRSQSPYLGHRDFALDVTDVAAGAVCAVGFATALQPQALGPCTLWLQGGPAVLLFAAANAYGHARVPLPLPLLPALAGVTLVAQGAVLATPGAFAGIDLTAARTLRLGD